MPSNRHNHLVRLSARIREDLNPFSDNPDSYYVDLPDDHLGDSITVSLGLVTNTPGDLVGLAGLTVTLMGDGFYLISRSMIGGASGFVASGQLEARKGTDSYAEYYAKLHDIDHTRKSVER